MQEAGGPLSSSPVWSVSRVCVSNNRKQSRKIPAPLKNASVGTKPKHLLRSSRNNQELIFASSRPIFFIGYTVLQVSVPSANLSAQSINLLFWLDKPKCKWKRRGPWGSSWQEDAQWTHDRPAEEVRADRGLGVHIPSKFLWDFEPGRSAAHSLLYVNWRSCVCPMHGWAVVLPCLSGWDSVGDISKYKLENLALSLVVFSCMCVIHTWWRSPVLSVTWRTHCLCFSF